MQTSTPALQRDFENAVFQAIGSNRVRPRDALFGIERSTCNEKTYLI